MRLGLIGLHLETAVRNPLPSTAASFRVSRGEEAWDTLAADAILGLLGDDPPELAPVWYARARPGGRLDRDDAEELLDEMKAALAAIGPLDGLLLAQHGGLRIAAATDGAEAGGDLRDLSPTDGEARVVAACREVVGDGVPIVACYDPHGDPGDRALALLDGACAFRTAPHVDVVASRARAMRLLMSTLRRDRRPHVAMVRGSLVLPGAVAEGPGAGAEAFAAAARMSDLPGVLDASWLLGSPWTDRPDERALAGAGFLVVAEDEPTALRAARDANTQVERNEDRFRFRDRLIAVGEAARRAAGGADDLADEDAGSSASDVAGDAARDRPTPTTPDGVDGSPKPATLLLDAGDAIGAGAVGDRWEAALALLDAGARDVLIAGVVAPTLLARCRAAGDGATLLATVGPELAAGAGGQGAARPRDADDERGRVASETRMLQTHPVEVHPVETRRLDARHVDSRQGETRQVELRVERASIDLAAFAAAGDADVPPPAPGVAALVTLGGVQVLVRSTRREIADWTELERVVGPLSRWRTVVVKATRRPAGYPVDGSAWTLASPGATDHRVGVASGVDED